MKKIEILDKGNKPIELIFGEVTNLVGSNNDFKNYIFDYMNRYFSKSKYQDDDVSIYNYNLPYLKVNDKEVGRNFYKVYCISNEDDLKNLLESVKGSIVNEYVLNLFNDIEISKNIEKIRDLVISISVELKSNSREVSYLNFYDKNINKETILKNFIDAKVRHNDYSLDFISSYEKIKIFLEIIEKICKVDNDSKLIMIRNIESFVSIDELREISAIILKLSKTYDIDFLITSSKSDYVVCDIEQIEYINIVSDEVRSLPDLSSLAGTINRNYPTNIEFTESEVYEIVRGIVNDLFNEEYCFGYSQRDVIIKLLNKFYNIECKKIDRNISESEKNYLLF